MVFDNFDDIDVSIAPLISSTLSGQILITSRDRHIVGPIASEGLQISGIGHKEAVGLLLRLHQLGTSNNTDDPSAHPEFEAIRKIVEELQAFPLAIDQAAAFIRENSPLTFAEYYEYLQPRSENRELLMRFKEVLPKYPGSVMTTWEITLHHLERDYHRASKILQLLGYMSHSEIPETVLREATKQIPFCFGNYKGLKSLAMNGITDLGFLADNIELRQAIGKLISLSMIQRSTKSAYGPLLSLHPLVHEWVRIRSNRDPQLQARLAINAAFILYHSFPIEAVARPFDEALDQSIHDRYRVDMTYLQLDYVYENLKEYWKHAEEVPLEVSTFLGTVMLAARPQRRIGTFDFVTTIGGAKIKAYLDLLQNLIARSDPRYGDFLSNFNLALKCLLSKNAQQVLLHLLPKLSARLARTTVPSSTLSFAEEQLLAVLFATIKDLADLALQNTFASGGELITFMATGPDSSNTKSFQVQEMDKERKAAIGLLVALRHVFSPIRGSLKILPQVQLSLCFRLGDIMTADEYWGDSDHHLTEAFNDKAAENFDSASYCRGLSLATKMHWERSGSKDTTELYKILDSALHFAEMEYTKCDTKISSLSGSMSTRASYLSSAFGRTDPTSFSAAKSCSCRETNQKLSYVY